MTSVVIAAVLVLAAVVAVVRLPALHPAQLWLLPWAAATTLNALHLLPYREPSWATVAVVCGGNAAFVGALLLFRRRPAPADAPPDGRGAVESAALLASALALLALAAFLADMARRFGVRAALVSSMDVRNAIGTGSAALTIKYLYVALAAVVLCAAAAGRARYAGTPHRRWLLLSAAMVATTYFGTGRATVISAVVAAAVTYALTSGIRIDTRRFLVAALGTGTLALVVLVVGGHLIGKTVANNPDVATVPSFFADHEAARSLALPYHYAAAPVSALDVQVRRTGTWGETDGCATFAPACSVLGRLGAPAQPVPAVRPFTGRPFSWNTYTGLDAVLLDGGFALFAPLLALFGAGVGLLWSRAAPTRPRWAMAYGVAAAALVSGYGTFNFTAPHLLAAVLIAAALPTATGLVAARRRDPPPSGT